MIYVIGDSHVYFFLGVNKRIWRLEGACKSIYPFFEVHYVGPATAYSLNNDNSKSQGKKNLFKVLENIPKGSTVLLCFGDIDCRFHLPKYQNIDYCVKEYFKVIRQIVKLGFKVALWGVTSKEINKIVEDFNSYLREKANDEHNKVIYIYRKLLGKDEYFLPDGVHLSQKAMPLVLDELKRKGLL